MIQENWFILLSLLGWTLEILYYLYFQKTKNYPVDWKCCFNNVVIKVRRDHISSILAYKYFGSKCFHIVFSTSLGTIYCVIPCKLNLKKACTHSEIHEWVTQVGSSCKQPLLAALSLLWMLCNCNCTLTHILGIISTVHVVSKQRTNIKSPACHTAAAAAHSGLKSISGGPRVTPPCSLKKHVREVLN